MAKSKKTSLESLRKTYTQIKATLKRRLQSKKKKKAFKGRRRSRVAPVSQSERNLITAIKAKKSAERRKKNLPTRLLSIPRTPRTVEICEPEGGEASSKLYFILALELIPKFEKQKRGPVLRRRIPVNTSLPDGMMMMTPRVVMVKHVDTKKTKAASAKKTPKVEQTPIPATPATPRGQRRGRPAAAMASTPIRRSLRGRSTTIAVGPTAREKSSRGRLVKPRASCICCQ